MLLVLVLVMVQMAEADGKVFFLSLYCLCRSVVDVVVGQINSQGGGLSVCLLGCHFDFKLKYSFRTESILSTKLDRQMISNSFGTHS